MPLVSVITATIGRDHLRRALASVDAQTHGSVQHLVVIDGAEHEPAARHILQDFPEADVIVLPYPTRQWGGRIYAAMPHITRGDYVLNLDDDNFLSPNHISSLLATIGDSPWAYSLRNITQQGRFIMQDNCESLGPLHSVWNAAAQGLEHHHIDTGCYFLRRDVAVELSPYWAPSDPNSETYINDRYFYANLVNRYPTWLCSGLYTVNYEVPAEKLPYFELGKNWMETTYPDRMPWRR